MSSNQRLIFKIASEGWEYEQIHRLNYSTFVEEIPQHEENPNQLLVDRFHQENSYIICLREKHLVGMLAIRGKRPFSLDYKLENLDSYLPESKSIIEIRLLSVDRRYRTGRILKGLLSLLFEQVEIHGYDLAVISATLTQFGLHKHLGFIPFGPIVGEKGAYFQPMYATPEAYKALKEKFRLIDGIDRFSPSLNRVVNLLPGPVGINKSVRDTFSDIPLSHRSEKFINDFQHTRAKLCELVNSRNVEILMGSGSLANDCIAAQLSVNFGQGLILSNGEFGNRLIDHATRFGLNYHKLQIGWGEIFDLDFILDKLSENQNIDWLWAVHCETSTGVMNDLEGLKEICIDKGIRLCMDSVSSIGTVPIDLYGVYLASGVSGKGLGAFPGLSMVFYNHEIQPISHRIPRYLDLGLYSTSKGIPFTISSNLLYALKKAVEVVNPNHRYQEILALSSWLRQRLNQIGFKILADEANASPALITIALPGWISSPNLGKRLEEEGYLLSYRSEYLLKRNWIQISLMGECSQDIFRPLLDLLEKIHSQACRAS